MPKLWRAPIPMVRITAPQITAIQKLCCRGLAAASDDGTDMGPPREKQKPGSCRQRGDLNGVAEVLQTHDEASGVDGFGPLVEVVRAEIAIELTADQHVVDAGQDRGGER